MLLLVSGDTTTPGTTPQARHGAVERAVERAVDDVEHAFQHAKAVVKPLMRGWLHLGTFPLALLGGLLLVLLADSTTERVVTVVFTICTSALFGVSATYHRGRWSERTRILMKRLDHSSIFLLIAGSYTPYAVLLLPTDQARLLMGLVWGGAVLGILFRVFWVGAPRWLYTPIYIVLGWTAVWFLPGLYEAGGALVVALLVAGGLLYSGGAVVYALKRPDPWPNHFGFHEIFHACTVLAFACHYTGVLLVVTGTLPG
jgi:hemolysin III